MCWYNYGNEDMFCNSIRDSRHQLINQLAKTCSHFLTIILTGWVNRTIWKLHTHLREESVCALPIEQKYLARNWKIRKLFWNLWTEVYARARCAQFYLVRKYKSRDITTLFDSQFIMLAIVSYEVRIILCWIREHIKVQCAMIRHIRYLLKTDWILCESPCLVFYIAG